MFNRKFAIRSQNSRSLSNVFSRSNLFCDFKLHLVYVLYTQTWSCIVCFYSRFAWPFFPFFISFSILFFFKFIILFYQTLNLHRVVFSRVYLSFHQMRHGSEVAVLSASSLCPDSLGGRSSPRHPLTWRPSGTSAQTILLHRRLRLVLWLLRLLPRLSSGRLSHQAATRTSSRLLPGEYW